MWPNSSKYLTVCLYLIGILLYVPVIVYGTVFNEQNLQDDIEMETDALNNNFDKRGGWQSLHGTWGKRAFGWNQGSEDGSGNDNTPSLLYVDEDSAVQPNLETQETNDLVTTDKRTWKNMNVAWGKRRNPPAWNKFRGAWGKREPGWNNLKGMWGKRDAKQWQKLHTGWGKRDPLTYVDTN